MYSNENTGNINIQFSLEIIKQLVFLFIFLLPETEHLTVFYCKITQKVIIIKNVLLLSMLKNICADLGKQVKN